MSDLITALVVDLTNVGLRLAVFYFMFQLNPFSAYLIGGTYCINHVAKYLHKKNLIKNEIKLLNNLLQQNQEQQKKQERLDRF